MAADNGIIIIGAGVFGLTTALELSKRGYQDITVLDRMTPPVSDGSSVDISRIVRYDYYDPFYVRLAMEAVQAWRTGPFTPFYHGSGFVLTSEEKENPFLGFLTEVLASKNQPFTVFSSSEELKRIYSDLSCMKTNFNGYINPNGGWVDAAGSIRQLASMCSERDISFVTGARGTATSLKLSGQQVVGVNVTSGTPILGSKVILATGAWTNHFLNLTHAMTASAQPVGFIQLSKAEASTIADMPVLINMSSGFFIFPPTPDHVLKVARHSHGFETRENSPDDRVISAPKTASNNAASSFLPDDADSALREGLRQVVPQFAQKPWMRRRLCWYTDTPEGNFVADFHPSIQGLFVAAGGAGHAFKFLPVLGKYLVDCFEGKADEEVKQKWKLRDDLEGKGPMVNDDASRRGPPRRLLSRDEHAKLWSLDTSLTAVEDSCL